VEHLKSDLLSSAENLSVNVEVNRISHDKAYRFLAEDQDPGRALDAKVTMLMSIILILALIANK